MGEDGLLLDLISHAIVPKGCYTNIQTVLSIVTQLFKISMEKQNVTHCRIPEMAYGYNAETRISKLYSRVTSDCEIRYLVLNPYLLRDIFGFKPKSIINLEHQPVLYIFPLTAVFDKPSSLECHFHVSLFITCTASPSWKHRRPSALHCPDSESEFKHCVRRNSRILFSQSSRLYPLGALYVSRCAN